jgi:hypothetical protein
MRQTKVHKLRAEIYELIGRSPSRREWRLFKKGILLKYGSQEPTVASMTMGDIQDFFKVEKKIEETKQSWLQKLVSWFKKLWSKKRVIQFQKKAV